MAERYIDEHESIYAAGQHKVSHTLATIADRFVGNHPPHPMKARAFCADGIVKKHNYCYDFNMVQRFPELRNGQYVYAWSKFWSDQAAQMTFHLYCYGPVQFYANGVRLYKATISEELNDRLKIPVTVSLNKGWNHFVLLFTKTQAGCGGAFGPSSFKSNPIHVLAPTPERSGHEGWIYSAPQDAMWEQLPGPGTNEADSGIEWYPKLAWSEAEQALSPLARIYGDQPGRYAVAWTKLDCSWREPVSIALTGSAAGSFELYINGEKKHIQQEAGAFSVSLLLSFGTHDLLIRCTGACGDWGFRLDELPAGVALQAPHHVEGSRDEWMYAGPFAAADPLPEAAEALSALLEAEGGSTFWRLDQPHTWVRLFVENALFGKWNYPLGVTLYGMLQTGKLLEREDVLAYVRKHIETCTKLYRYAVWDKAQFGASGVLNTLATLDSLDDCGSFGATMLLTLAEHPLEGADEVAELVADYICNRQERLPTGALYRKPRLADFTHETIWCDDLYMSVPFLCRYYHRTKDIRYIDDAANQFIQFKKLMYVPELQIMSHVYDLTLDKPTMVAWGRGNGWVLFSLSELLAAMPEAHEKRAELLHFFNELCEGYLRLQGVNGMWHQVLTDAESYEETSCTSMFLYAFARGVRFGWLSDSERYIEAIRRGWEGMTRISIDKFGNVYGVCRGSGYSFNGDYYKHDLSWLLNDTHGIGIVLLAGIEVLQIEQWLLEEKAAVRS